MQMQPGRKATVIGAALDLGSGRRGVDMGPSAIRYAGLDGRIKSLGYAYDDRGNVGTAVAEAIEPGDEHARFLPQIKETCRHIADLVAEAAGSGSIPVVLGGDYSVALGTLGGLRRVHGPGGVLWLDAHGDLNSPETSPSGNVHGMVLAAALGRAGERFEGDGWELPALVPSRVALVGVRSLDEGERELLKELDALVFTISLCGYHREAVKKSCGSRQHPVPEWFVDAGWSRMAKEAAEEARQKLLCAGTLAFA